MGPIGLHSQASPAAPPGPLPHRAHTTCSPIGAAEVRLRSQAPSLMTLRPWASSQCFHCPICKVGVIVVSTSQGPCNQYVIIH